MIPYLAELVVVAQFLPKNHSSSAWLLLLCLVMMLGERSVIYPHLHQELWHLRRLATASVTWLAGQSWEEKKKKNEKNVGKHAAKSSLASPLNDDFKGETLGEKKKTPCVFWLSSITPSYTHWTPSKKHQLDPIGTCYQHDRMLLDRLYQLLSLPCSRQLTDGLAQLPQLLQGHFPLIRSHGHVQDLYIYIYVYISLYNYITWLTWSSRNGWISPCRHVTHVMMRMINQYEMVSS